jgi:hypothetical protein
MKSRLFDTLSKINTTLSLWDRVFALALLLLPSSLITWIYATTDKWWKEYGWLGAAVLFLGAVLVIGISCGGIALLVMAWKPPKAEEPKKWPPGSFRSIMII